VTRKFRVSTTDSNHDQPVFKNTLSRAVVADTINQKWACDITYIQTEEGFVLILAIAYLLLCGIGLIAKTRFKPGAWCSSNRDSECSIYTIGLMMLKKIRATPPQAFAAVLELSETVLRNWG